ncbi:MAG: Omp28-related outer membrane protein [Chitinophagales bacterium]
MKALTILLFSLLLLESSYAQVTKKVVLEDLTASWCGLCPEGKLTYDSIMTNFDNVIGVGVHINDPMSNDITDALSEEYSGGGVNVFLLDRYLFEDRNFAQFSFQYEPLAEKLQERLDMTAPVSVSFEDLHFDEESRELTATVRADFHQDIIDKDIRFNLLLTEDSIMRNEGGYTQSSYFNDYDGHAYQGAGNPIHNFVHRSVLRQSLGGMWGAENSLPAVIEAGSSHQFNFSTVLPIGWNKEQIYLVGLVQTYGVERSEQAILNAEDIRLKTFMEQQIFSTSIEEDNALNQLFRIYPNPILSAPLQIVFDLARTSPIRLQVFDIHGRLIHVLRSETMNQGLHTVRWNLQNAKGQKVIAGTYVLVLEDDRGNRQIQKVAINNH